MLRASVVLVPGVLTVLAAGAATLTTPAAEPPAPLRQVADIPLPGPAVRFDYQSLDATTRRLYISHMNADRLVVFDTRARRVVADLDGFPGVRGVWAVPELKRVYAAARASHEVVVVDGDSLKTVARIAHVSDPDGIAYAPSVNRIFVSDQRSGADVVIDAKTNAVVKSVVLGGAAGNTVYDPGSGHILVAVEPSELVVIDPARLAITARYPLPGVADAHGITLDVASRLAYVAGEGNHSLGVVDLAAGRLLATHSVGEDPDVLAFDPGVGLLYVSAESGTVAVFARRGKQLEGRGTFSMPHAHTVCVDPATHLVYFPLEDVGGRPVLRIMEPATKP